MIMSTRPLPDTAKQRDNLSEPAAPAPARAWEPPRMSYVGHVAEVLQGGGGKLSPVTADSGDIRKPPGQE